MCRHILLLCDFFYFYFFVIFLLITFPNRFLYVIQYELDWKPNVEFVWILLFCFNTLFFIYLFKYRYSAFDHWFFVLFSLLWWVWYMTLTLLSRHLFSFMKCSCPMKAKTSRQQQQQCYFYARQGSKKQSPATYCHHKNYLYATEIPP